MGHRLKTLKRFSVYIKTITALFIICFFIVIPIAAFPVSGTKLHETEKQSELINQYNDTFDFSNFEVVDTKILPFSSILLLNDTKHQQLYYFQAEKYIIYSRYRFIFYPQPIAAGESVELRDFFYRINFQVVDRRLSAVQHFSPRLSIISLLILTISNVGFVIREHSKKIPQ